MDLSQWSRQRLVSELLNTAYRPQAVRRCNEPTFAASPSAIVSRKLAVARELLMRDLITSLADRPVLGEPNKVRDWLRLYYARIEHEVFTVLFLDCRYRLIDAVPMFRGTLTQTNVYPREIVKSALDRNAASVILAHNHPSGEAEPSHADQFMTRTVKTALQTVDVQVIDHLVVGGWDIVSFAERGEL